MRSRLDIKLPEELSFLNAFWLRDRRHQYRESRWLSNNFEDNAWHFLFGEKMFTVSFEIKLYDGSNLTDIHNAGLLNSIKSWLCLQHHSDVTGTPLISDHLAYSLLVRTLRVIDYLLLNGSNFSLAQHGLMALTQNDVKVLILKFSATNSSHISIYDWPARIAVYLREKITVTETHLLYTQLTKVPILKTAVLDHDLSLGLSEEEIHLSRAWLSINGHYSKRKTDIEPGCVSTGMMVREIYANTLYGFRIKPSPFELDIHGYSSYGREHPDVPIRKTNDVASSIRLNQTIRSLNSLRLLDMIGLQIPEYALSVVDTENFEKSLSLATPGKFTSIDPREVLKSLGRSIDFFYDYGNLILDGTACVISDSICSRDTHDKTIGYAFTPARLDPALQYMGVKCWRVHISEKGEYTGKLAIADYHSRIRNHEGLIQLYQVVLGCIQYCVGLLTARRQEELRKLTFGNVFNSSKTHLIVELGKTGIRNTRIKKKIVVPPLVVEMIERLKKFYFDCGFSKTQVDKIYVFARPSRKNLLKLIQPNARMYDENFDVMCDYFNLPLDALGRRQYTRQHQLRKAFALCFYWSGAGGGLDTLRDYLGHTNLEHLYHYILLEIPGATLRNVQSLFAAQQIKDHNTEFEELKRLVVRDYTINDIEIVDQEVLASYIEVLILKGVVVVEPEFIKTANGSDMLIHARVRA